jgi:phage shock protein E
MGILSNLFGKGESTNYKELVQNGAVIIDVRTPQEFAGGHIKGSKNIPLNVISTKVNELKKYDNIIVCCQSGMRSANAASILKQAGLKNVFNGGGWNSLNSKL